MILRRTRIGRWLAPRSNDEDDYRRELVLVYLLLGLTVLMGAGLISVIINALVMGDRFQGLSPLYLASGVVAMIFLLLLRCSHPKIAAHIVIIILFVAATFPLIVWGSILPQALLLYALLVVISGVLISSRMALIMTFITTTTLLIITFGERHQLLHPDLTWIDDEILYGDAINAGVIFGLMTLIAWLSNRELQRALVRTRRSELDLTKERDSLEVRVFERTKELEGAQLEKLQEMERFAEFGRITSGLVHDLSNPLTAATINLEQIPTRERDQTMRRVQDSLNYINEYVNLARSQLNREGNIRRFTVMEQVNKVVTMLEHRSRESGVKIIQTGDILAQINGDPIKFRQIIANLLVNAVDSYLGIPRESQKVVKVDIKCLNGRLLVSVTDNGCGIDAATMEKLFNPFTSTKKGSRSVGIGLTVIKRLIQDDFDGQINVESAHGQTVFSVELPFDKTIKNNTDLAKALKNEPVK